ncbi:MAG TPA: tRNA preQ1(34) S-adenosylmethionine ribosyltransferase-isomerase QueA [Anaerolineales bacterium]|nr:tRNA preQ1(34) S-adenosylmethionine ribosyltransferase-isomerase QueA [Anaerolineales bacterium]
MKTSDFDYDLPPEYIAQTPAEPRDSSHLLVLDRATGQLTHTIFREIDRFLHPGDLLVLNETRVIPARLFGRKLTGGRIEILLLRRVDETTWDTLVGGKGMTVGKRLQLEDGPEGEVIEVLDGAERRIRFETPLADYLNRAGHVPLPPYIRAPLADASRYQTVYAHHPGSAAAPTAGLHFTPELFARLEGQGIGRAFVTLHIGLDTFAPVTVDDPQQHVIHTEWCQVSEATADAVNRTRREGGRVVCVGTTSVRTLESAARFTPRGQDIQPFEGPTNLFILPGYEFRVVDAMVTNFHLPKSTLLMMMSAFAGRERMLGAYETAKQEGYRFFSFGDAMLVV